MKTELNKFLEDYETVLGESKKVIELCSTCRKKLLQDVIATEYLHTRVIPSTDMYRGKPLVVVEDHCTMCEYLAGEYVVKSITLMYKTPFTEQN